MAAREISSARYPRQAPDRKLYGKNAPGSDDPAEPGFGQTGNDQAGRGPLAHATSTCRQPSRVRAQFVDDRGAYWELAKREDPSQRWAAIQATRRNSALWQLGDAGPRGLRLI